MLKKVVCMVILVMTILATVTVANVGAKQADIEEVGKNVEITCLMGDVDLDGKVTIKDASKIQKNSPGIINLSDRQIMASDVTGNTIIDVRDATTIQKFLAGVPYENCIGEVKVVQVMVDENGNIRWDDEEEFVGYPEELDVESIENAIEKRFLELEDRTIQGEDSYEEMYFTVDQRHNGKIYLNYENKSQNRTSYQLGFNELQFFLRTESGKEYTYKLEFIYNSDVVSKKVSPGESGMIYLDFGDVDEEIESLSFVGIIKHEYGAQFGSNTHNPAEIEIPIEYID